MRIISICILTIFAATTSYAQKANSEKAKKVRIEFKNQGEQVDYWDKELFKAKYKKQCFERFPEVIKVVNDETFIYQDKTLIVYDTSDELKIIFKSGLFYPEIITGKSRVNSKTKSELKAMTVGQRQLYNLVVQDSLKISGLNELKFLNTTPLVKRFRFLLFRKGLLNPTKCYFELTNETAISSTNLSSFIEGSKLTFFMLGSIMI